MMRGKQLVHTINIERENFRPQDGFIVMELKESITAPLLSFGFLFFLFEIMFERTKIDFYDRMLNVREQS